MEKNLLTTQETAKLLGLSDSRIRRMILDGTIPAQKFGRQNMIKKSDAEKVRVYGKTGRPKHCPEHNWIKLNREGICSFCLDKAIEESKFETCQECGHRRKIADSVWDEVEDDPICEKCGAYESFR